ncbi:MAG: M36 family metallopeptidase [Acidobacteria bacterium]|nr:M36 family metallopeptidase [Acidobacteriota bacterium]
MQQNFGAGVRSPLVWCAAIIGLMTALVYIPLEFRPAAGGRAPRKGLVQRTESREAGLDNYDIRNDKSAIEKLRGFRQSQNKDAALVADVRARFVTGEAALQAKIPTLKVEYNTDIGIPEVIGPDVKRGRAFLSGPSGENRAAILRDFVKDNQSLVGVTRAQADDLKVTADYTNPDGNLSFASLAQTIDGIPVFRGEVKAGFTKQGELVRVINNLAPGLDYVSAPKDFGDPADAVRAAYGFIDRELPEGLTATPAASTALKTVFGQGDWATTAEKMYFPTEPGVAIPAWRVLVWQPVNAYYVIVDAATGTPLWRKNLTEDQTQPATYNVYTNPNAMINIADNPFPLTPGPVTLSGQQGAAISRTQLTLVGNEAPYAFNNNGWITDGGNETDGNAVEAGLDRDTTNGVDTANGRAAGTSRTFNFAFNPFNPNTNTGDSPVPAGEPASTGTVCASITQPHAMVDAQRAAITQLFYINNRYHDEMYRLGFTEQAGNFQNSNFGRGGVEADRVSAEAQDCSGGNNANFSTAADGVRGRMQMYLWVGPNPDIDGDLDADVVIHEHTHGLSNRLHGNGSGLSTNMSRGMGEGWSDFYAHSLLSEPTDPINGIYTTGGYATYNITTGFVNNYYYGIRRFPKAVKSFTGGPNNLPHNPLTFADVDAAQFNISDGAFPRGPVGSSIVDQVHNMGEIWSSALWEVRAKFVTRLGWATGNRKALQLVTDGMKLAPIGPTFLQERDAIISAARASSSFAPQAEADAADVWGGFAIRGMGYSATVNSIGTGNNDTSVTEAFDLPNLQQLPALTVSDAAGDNDGYFEPGETVTLTIPLVNDSGAAANNTTLQIVGGNLLTYGTIANGAAASQSTNFTIPANTACGAVLTLTLNATSSLGPTSFTRTISIGAPVTTSTENFDGVTAPAFPAGWTAVSVQSGINFVNSTLSPDTGANSAFAADPTATGGGSDLTSPVYAISAAATTLSFRHRFDTETGWDGGVVEISIAGGAFQDIIAAGGTFLQNGYNGTLGANGTNNPLGGRQSWSGNSNGYITTVIRLPASAAGQNVQFKWRFGADNNTAGVGPNPGWYVDTIGIATNFACSFNPNVKSRADFDGDGKTDLSVFRPADGVWYLNRSTAGFTAVGWGVSSDVATPGDFDGDGKTDVAIWRPATGVWYILQSSNGAAGIVQFGASGDVPVAADFDGDGKTDVAVFRPSTNVWYILNSGGGVTISLFGAAGDVPVRADYNGDGKADIAVFRPSTGQWWIANSGGAVTATVFGVSTDKPVPADYDGDNKDDVAVFRPATGTWWILRSSNGAVDTINFGIASDVPVPGDYDGDGKDDQAVYRSGTWWLNRSTAGVTSGAFGTATDTPAPARYIP